VAGERWSLLIVRELLLGAKRFSDLLGGLAGASPNVISQRLRDLVAHGVVHRRKLGPPARIHLYELTDWGRELEPVVLHLGRWGAKAPLPEGGTLSVDSLVLSLKAMFDPAQARKARATFELRIDDEVFVLELADGTLRAQRSTASSPDATITADRSALMAALLGRRSLDDLHRANDLVITGTPRGRALATTALLAPAIPARNERTVGDHTTAAVGVG
jgi:DNA-binding HxlR family transcriptional regulator